MRMTKGRELSSCDQWKLFKIPHDRLELPTGQLVTARQVLTGIALLEIGALTDQEVAGHVLKYARALRASMSKYVRNKKGALRSFNYLTK